MHISRTVYPPLYLPSLCQGKVCAAVCLRQGHSCASRKQYVECSYMQGVVGLQVEGLRARWSGNTQRATLLQARAAAITAAQHHHHQQQMALPKVGVHSQCRSCHKTAVPAADTAVQNLPNTDSIKPESSHQKRPTLMSTVLVQCLSCLQLTVSTLAT